MLAGEAWLESLFGDVFVISVRRIFCMNILLLEQLGQAKNRSGETESFVSIFNHCQERRVQGYCAYQSRV